MKKKRKELAKRSLKAACVLSGLIISVSADATAAINTHERRSVCQEHRPAVVMAVRIGSACTAAAV